MFKRRFVKVILALIAIFSFTSTLLIKNTLANSDNTFYIKNSYAVGAYMYEDDEGVLRYGIPLKNALEFKWEIINTDQGVLIKNVKSNNYLTLKDYLGNNFDPVKILPLDENDDRYYWNLDIEVESGVSQNISSKSEEFSGYVLHLEGITNGQVAAEKLSGENLGWGNVKWLLYKEAEINFDAIIRDGFCILNNISSEYLYLDEQNKIRFGNITSPDDAYIWLIEVNNNNKVIKNKKTGTYLSLSNYNQASQTLSVVSNISGELEQWSFSIAVNTKIKGVSSNFTDYAFSGSESELKVKKFTTITDDLLFSVIPASNVKNAVGDLILEDKIYNLKNAWFLMYLIEDNGLATYGNASPSDPLAQWRIKYDVETGKTALINVATGNYLHPGAGENGLILDKTTSYYWNLLRNKNDMYPDAVLFQDSERLNYYLHMETLNGYAENSNAVQPTWGTPHWIPIAYDSSTPNASFTLTSIDEEYVRIKSVYGKNLYLYETSAGGLAYDETAQTDARSHWQFVKSENGYYLKNRRFENYFANMGNGVLRAFAKTSDIPSGGEFILYKNDDTDIYLIGNYYENLKDYLMPYINISSLTGLARSSLVPIDARTTQWTFEEAKDGSDIGGDSSLGNVDLTVFKDSNTYLLIQNNKYLSGKYNLEYQGNFVKVIKQGSDLYLYNNGGKFEFAKLNNPFDTRILFTLTTKLGKTYLVNNDVRIQLASDNSNPTYLTSSSYKFKNHVTYTVFSLNDGEYEISLNKDSEINPIIYVNGISIGEFSNLNNKVKLNKGINTIKVSNADKVTSLTLNKGVGNAYRGASVTYQTYEAEDMDTNANVLMEDVLYRTIQSESSGRSAVVLERTTHHVKFTLSEDTNALVIRYSIPDSKDGKGMDATLSLYADNKKLDPINMTSKHTHLYGAYPWNNNPNDGNLHVYYDEVRFLLDKTYPKGTEIKLQKDVSSYAEKYVIDLVEGYNISAPLTKPENAISITDFGAIANDGLSDLNALTSAIAVAKASNKEVWIPSGIFNMEGTYSINDDNIVIRGAGAWHSIIEGGINFAINASNTAFYDFSLMGIADVRRDSLDRAAFEVKKSNAVNLLVQNLWIVHYKCGFWLSYMDNIHLVGNKVRYTYADGANLHAGVINGYVEQNDFMSTGDDTIGLWSQGTSNLDIVIKFNTIRNPWLANGVGIYGGTNITVSDNIIKDTVYAGAGVNISTNFQPTPFVGSVKVLRNTIIRCGSENQNDTVGGIWFNTVLGYDNKAHIIIEDNLILNSSFQGVSFGGNGRVNKVSINNNVIINSGTWGLEIAPNTNGTLVARNNQIERSMLENFKNDSNNFIADVEVQYIKANSVQKTSWDITKIIVFAIINLLLAFTSIFIYYYIRSDLKRRGQ